MDHPIAFFKIDEKEYFKASGSFSIDVLNEILGGHWVRKHIKDPFQDSWKGEIDETLSERNIYNARKMIF